MRTHHPLSRPLSTHHGLPRVAYACAVCVVALCVLSACGDSDETNAETNTSNSSTSTNSGSTGTNNAATSTNGGTSATNSGTTSADAGMDAEDDASSDDGGTDGGEEGCPPVGEPGVFFETSVPLEIPIDGQPFFRGSWDGREDLAYLIDTGAQITSFDADLTDGDVAFFQAERLGLVTVNMCEVIVKGRDLSEAEAYIGVNIDALLGQSALADMYVYIDYRDRQAWLYDVAPDVAPPGMDGVTPFEMVYELQNQLPVANIGLSDTLTLPLLTDTGSGVSIVTQSFFDQIEAEWGEPLPRLEGYQWATNYGVDLSFVTRLPELRMGEAVIRGEWVVVIPDDHHIRALLEGSSVFIEGFLGYPHYRHFITEVRGPDGAFRFWPYPDTSHIPDGEWHRVGLDLTARPEGPRVEMVFSPSDAHDQGVTRGDILVSVDGVGVTDMTVDAIRYMLRGTPGDTRTLVFTREGEDEPIALEVAVEDLLPPLEQ